MKLTDLARMIFSNPHEPSKPPTDSTSTVSPPAFTVPVPIGTVTQTDPATKASEAPTIDVSSEEKPVAMEIAKTVEASPVIEPVAKETVEAKAMTEPVSVASEPEKKTEIPATEKVPEAVTPTASGPAPIPPSDAPPKAPESDSAATPVSVENTLSKASEKKEFLLVNGERILGHVLSETPENIYLDHGTLGVLTLPRTQIATRPVEIILINGDRIVGDIMAETPDTLYVRHASLGMLTVPRAQRSTRVIEALLKDGDRILGEVLAETENFTVIRSATLGTVAVPHNKVAMLNRKIEQIELKSLPTTAPAIEDKPAGG
jgi:RNase P/RNase MRP subunit p29